MPQIAEPNNPPFPKNEMIQAISKLLKLGAISPCVEQRGQYISPVFLTPKSSGGYRFILNLKKFNNFVITDHFKMEDIRTASKLVSTGDYMATIDLKEAYFLVPIDQADKKYLRFRLDQLYEFNCLPYGLSSAPYVFTKLLKPLLSLLRNKGHTVVAYLDDLLCIGPDFMSCQDTVVTVVKHLENLGFVVNHEKSNLQPRQLCKFLGFEINTQDMVLQLPTEKINKIIALVKEIKRKRSIPIREFAKFIGTLTASCPAIAYSWIYTKHFEREKYLALQKHNDDYDSRMDLNKYLLEDFDWWENITKRVANPLHRHSFDLEIFTDSSLTGWGAVCDDVVARGHWSAHEKTHHINYLELKAVLLGLKSFCENVCNINVLLRVDNTTAIAYINRMGGIQFPHLNKITREIWQWCEARQIFIFSSYIRSRDNTDADRASRHTNIDTEWDLNTNNFQDIVQKFGQPDIDLFASRLNNKCTKYVSWKRDPGAYEIDAFTINWNRYFFYAFPPFALVLKCLRKIIEEEATGIFIIPNWPNQPWFPLFKSLVHSEVFYMKPNKNLLLSPSREHHPLWRNLTLACAILSGRRT